ncbi:hypothetical protein PoB_006328900 [Plakobranchus ocellatus]|uniref:Uncharacterized protein n=1 Tax=Plakobranchus ocellatus TaxID=259542 RepID=A0AAV4CY16_9GAST|nr:hypothetical protein PoB_006328900 [Plakobranchus ocellatus]
MSLKKPDFSATARVLYASDREGYSFKMQYQSTPYAHNPVTEDENDQQLLIVGQKTTVCMSLDLASNMYSVSSDQRCISSNMYSVTPDDIRYLSKHVSITLDNIPYLIKHLINNL